MVPQPIRSRSHAWHDPQVVAAAARGLSGREFLARVVAGEYRAPIQDTLELDLAAIGDGAAEYRLTPQEFHFNPAGTLHGGVMATIVDSAMCCAIWTTLPAGVGVTTMELKIGLLRAVTRESGTLVCRGSLIQAGQRSAAAEARVHDAAGRICAYASTTCMILRP